MAVEYVQLGNKLLAQATSDTSPGRPKAKDSLAWGAECQNLYMLALQKSADVDEPEKFMQKFLERHPAHIPGADNESSGGHQGPAAFNFLVSQPEIAGLDSDLWPDFMWVRTDSGAFYIRLVEIERPTKHWFLPKTGVPTAELTQAMDQLASWQTSLDDPETQQAFIRRFDLDRLRAGSPRRNPVFEYHLVFGLFEEFNDQGRHGSKADFLNRKRKKMLRLNEYTSLYDSLAYQTKASTAVTVKRGPHGALRVVALQKTFSTGPRFAQELARLAGIDVAIRDLGSETFDIKGSGLAQDRVDYLLERAAYWREAREEAADRGAQWFPMSQDTE